MVIDDRDVLLALSMENSNSSVNEPLRRNMSDDVYTVDQHFSLSTHSGLSALLSAVTLQLSESSEDGHNEECNMKKNASTSPVLGQPENEEDVSPMQRTNPTIVTESHSGASKLPTFPKKLMKLLMESQYNNMITWLPDGKYFALRSDKFDRMILNDRFDLDSMESFLSELATWGFALIATQRTGIEVFRHKLFRKGDWDRCKLIGRHETYSIDDNDSHTEEVIMVKRRLSSGHRKGSEDSDESSRKIRLQESGSDHGDDNEFFRRRTTLSEEHRLIARSITTEKLQIQQVAVTKEEEAAPFEQQAIVGATHTIVTDAIEALLKDEEHTKRCFAIHAEELSKSTIPGLVPISKQLFGNDEE